MIPIREQRDPIAPPTPEALEGERERIIRYCARFVGDITTAEDLTQETFYEALRGTGDLRNPAAWRGWLTGIARNVCLRYITERRKERNRLLDTASAFLLAEQIPDDSITPLEVLEREEREHLLDRALGALPPGSRDLLIERYLKERPTAELEERYGLTENTLHVRLHRSRLALRQVLFSAPFREETTLYGLKDDSEESDGWQPTNIWCPRCGKQKMEARFITDTPRPEFAVRCEHCQHYLGADFSANHAYIDTKRLLGGIKGFKPALNRLHQWWWEYEQKTVAKRHHVCIVCKRPSEVHFTPPPGTPAALYGQLQFYIFCPHCRRYSGPSPLGMAVVHPEVQRFWRRHHRMRGQVPKFDILLNNGTTATLTRFTSLTDNAAIEILFSNTDATILEVTGQDSPTENTSEEFTPEQINTANFL